MLGVRLDVLLGVQNKLATSSGLGSRLGGLGVPLGGLGGHLGCLGGAWVKKAGPERFNGLKL